MKRRYIALFVVLTIILLFLDYKNLPSLMGFEMSDINWEFLNIIVVIALYVYTYKILDEKAIAREQNKNEISILLIKDCYAECKDHAKMLTQEVVEKYIVPKVDFNSTDIEKSKIGNLQNSPFLNENIIMDFVKDGQLNKSQIEGYFKVKKIYRQYIMMRITFFDNPEMFSSLHDDLHRVIISELEKM